MVLPKDFEQILRSVNDKIFIETGTCNGSSLREIVKMGKYEQILSVEYLENSRYHNLEQVRKDFEKNKEVKIFKNNSVDFLNTLLPTVTEPCTFWLDAHADGTAPDQEYKGCGIPLRDELKIIKSSPIKTHTIMIDDVRCFMTYRLTKFEVEQIILSINPNYKISYHDCIFPNDVLVARV